MGKVGPKGPDPQPVSSPPPKSANGPKAQEAQPGKKAPPSTFERVKKGSIDFGGVKIQPRLKGTTDGMPGEGTTEGTRAEREAVDGMRPRDERDVDPRQTEEDKRNRTVDEARRVKKQGPMPGTQEHRDAEEAKRDEVRQVQDRILGTGKKPKSDLMKF